MNEVQISETAAKILRDLELPALRARFLALDPSMREIKSSSGGFYFYLDTYEFALSQDEREALRAKVRAVNERLIARRVELAADGIWPKAVAYAEAGSEHLTVFVEFGERGRKILQGSGVALSALLAPTRRYLGLGLTIGGILLVAVVVMDRINRQGWTATLIGLCVLVTFVIVIRRIFRKKPAGV
jgi:hypothetical protein